MKKTHIAILIGLFGCLTATPIVAKSADKVFADKYIYRLYYDPHLREYNGFPHVHERLFVLFANTKKAKGKRSEIGRCYIARFEHDSDTGIMHNAWLFELSLLAYKEKKKVYARCKPDNVLYRLILKE